MKYIYLFFFFILSLFCYSQQVRHTVQPKETLYGITKKYLISLEELQKLNPFLKERGLQPGDELIISSKQANNQKIVEEKLIVSQKEKSSNNSTDFEYITIKPKETLYNLTKSYNIGEAALKSLNPNLSEGLKEGDIIRVPKSNKTNPKGTHLVKSKETVFSIAKQYNLSTDDLYAANKSLQESSLEVGSYITIPEKKLVQKTEDGNFYHQVKPKETIYGIVTTYDVTLEDLILQNPSLKDGLKEGMELKIPVSKKAKPIVRKEKIVSTNDSYLNLVLFLPFEITKESSNYRKVATEFYLGSKLAIDSIGIKNKINVHLVDSGNETEFSDFLTSNDFSKTDLIVGPLKKDEILRVANQLKNSSIPIISPLSNSNEFENYSNIISTEPLALFMGERIAKEIADVHTDQKIYLIYGDDDEKNEAEQIKKSILKIKSKADVILSKSIENIQLKDNLITEQKDAIISVLVSSQSTVANLFLKHFSTFDEDKIRLFSTYYHNQYDSSTYKTFLRKSKLVYTIDRKINTNGENEKLTLDKFKSKYYANLDKYSIIGFDVTYDVLSRFISNNNKINLNTITTQLASKFEFIQLKQNGAFFNKGFRLVRMQE